MSGCEGCWLSSVKVVWSKEGLETVSPARHPPTADPTAAMSATAWPLTKSKAAIMLNLRIAPNLAPEIEKLNFQTVKF